MDANVAPELSIPKLMNVSHSYLTTFIIISLIIHILTIGLLNVRPLTKADNLPELSIVLLPPAQDQGPPNDQIDESAKKQIEVTAKTSAQVDVVDKTPEVTHDSDKPEEELNTEKTQQKPIEKSNMPPGELKIDWHKMASDYIKQEMINEINRDLFNKDKRYEVPSVMFGGLPEFMRTPDTSEDFPSPFLRQLRKPTVTVYGFFIADCLIGFKTLDYGLLEEQVRQETASNSTGFLDCDFF